jgi:hypothetical protein
VRTLFEHSVNFPYDSCQVQAFVMVNYLDCQSRVPFKVIGKTREYRMVHGTSASTDNVVLHFFGCLRFEEREKFLASLEPSDKARQRIEEEQARISALRNMFEMEGQNTAAGSLLYRFKVNLRQRLPTHRPRIIPLPNTRSEMAQQNLRRAEDREKEFVIEDLNANLIYFKRKEEGIHMEPHDHEKFLPSKFPDQKIKLSELLIDDLNINPLMWKCEKDMIRYFHIPANNMEWIEVSPCLCSEQD